MEEISNFIQKIKEINRQFRLETGRDKKAMITTFGCQMNARDSETVAGLLKEMGYATTQIEKEADFILYNTCCVRENAEKRVFGKLGYLKNIKKKNPALVIAVCGCMIQQDSMVDIIREKYRQVDLLFGTFNLHRLPELLYTVLTTGEAVVDIWEEHGEIQEDLPALRKNAFKASVNIMYGCDNFCAYCIVPYVRGRERSRKPQDILNEIKALSADGVKEITLLGQNVNSYGKKLAENVTFAKLLSQADQIEGIQRIRFMTSHPKDLSDDLIDVIAQSKHICRHIHLPVQSGSNRILKKMNRGYTKEAYVELINKIKDKIPDIAITTDIIVGYPEETEEDFEQTVALAREIGFSSAFTFQYSRRSGTPASQYQDLPPEVIQRRFEHLLSVLNPLAGEINRRMVGRTVEVLAEEESKKDKGIITGRTTHNTIVHFSGDKELIGRFVQVQILNSRTFYLEGVLV